MRKLLSNCNPVAQIFLVVGFVFSVLVGLSAAVGAIVGAVVALALK